MGTEIITRGFAGMAAKTCDICKSIAAALFCRADSAFMCLNCDTRIHSGTHHGRVWMCEVCEQAPAAVTCKADAASLCVTCDADIHSANPLARRHERVPLEPFFDSADSIVKSSPFSFLVPTMDHADCQQEDVTEAGSWLLPDPKLNPKLEIETNQEVKNGDFFFSEMDPFIDFEYHNMFQLQHDHNPGMDSVVPVHTKPVINNENCFEIEFGGSKPPTFSYHTPLSLSHSASTFQVSSCSLDVGVVPDGSDISYPFGRTMTDSSGAMSGTTTSSQASGLLMDREARVLRYREKRKNRKFEKTIRYASRKAYAETRPRIKGRFAKRSTHDHVNNNNNIMFNSPSAASFMSDTQFGLVPSF